MIDPARVERYSKINKRVMDQSSSENERVTARRVCAKMRKDYPGIHKAAIAFDESEAVVEPEWEEESLNWRTGLREWFRDTVSQVARGLSQADRIEEDVITDIRFDPERIVIITTIPMQSAMESAEDTGGSLQEYARLVGLRVGRDLSDLFEESGY